MKREFCDFWKETLEEIEGKDFWFYAVLTDQVILERWNVEQYKEMIEKQERKILELRLFSEEVEYKLFRGDVGEKAFYYRVLPEEPEDDYIEENHYRKENREQKIVIRNYISYYEKTGQAYVTDWRFVKLTTERGE